MEEGICGMQAIDSIQTNQAKPANTITYTNVGNFKKLVISKKCDEHLSKIIYQKVNKQNELGGKSLDLASGRSKSRRGGNIVIHHCFTKYLISYSEF